MFYAYEEKEKCTLQRYVYFMQIYMLYLLEKCYNSKLCVSIFLYINFEQLFKYAKIQFLICVQYCNSAMYFKTIREK